jgi:hypothetical protein
VIADGMPAEICNLFYERSDMKIKHDAQALAKRFGNRHISDDIELLDIKMVNGDGLPISVLTYESDVTVVIRYKANVYLPKPHFGLGVHTTDFIYLVTDHSDDELYSLEMTPGIYEVRCNICKFPLLPGVYALRLGVSVGQYIAPVFYAESVYFFQVIPTEKRRSAAMQEAFVAWTSTWSAERQEDHRALRAT